MLHERATSLCNKLLEIKNSKIGVVFNGSTALIKEGVVKYNAIPDKWIAVINTYLLINYMDHKSLVNDDDISYLTDQRELVDALHPIGEKADEENYSDEQFYNLCVNSLSDKYSSA